MESRIDILALDHAGRDALDVSGFVRGDWAFAIDRLAERVDHAAKQRIADRYRRDGARGANFVAFFDIGVFTHDDNRHSVFFEVEHEAQGTGFGELDQLALHRLREAIHRGDAVTNADHLTDVGNRRLV